MFNRVRRVLLLLPACCAVAPPGVAFGSDGPGAVSPGQPGSTPPAAPSGTPPPFTAFPFADEFVTTGAGLGSFPPGRYFPSDGDGTFGPPSEMMGLGKVAGTDVADMDGDGDNDFLMCDEGDVHYYINLGGGEFVANTVAHGITDSSFCTNLRIADFNGDSIPDFVVGDTRNFVDTRIFLQGPVGSFYPSSELDTSWTNNGLPVLAGVAAGDLDGDGHADVVLLGYKWVGDGEVRFYKGDGAGGVALPVLLFDVGDDFGTTGNSGIAMFDLDSDGDRDLIVGGGGSPLPGRHYVYSNDGSGNFGPGVLVFQVASFSGLDDFDADHDGDDDLLLATWGGLYYVENLGGVLAAPVLVANLPGLGSLGVGAPREPLLPGPDPVPATSVSGRAILVLLLLTSVAVVLTSRRPSSQTS